MRLNALHAPLPQQWSWDLLCMAGGRVDDWCCSAAPCYRRCIRCFSREHTHAYAHACAATGRSIAPFSVSYTHPPPCTLHSRILPPHAEPEFPHAHHHTAHACHLKRAQLTIRAESPTHLMNSARANISSESDAFERLPTDRPTGPVGATWHRYMGAPVDSNFNTRQTIIKRLSMPIRGQHTPFSQCAYSFEKKPVQ
jgi:hypothetical protein